MWARSDYGCFSIAFAQREVWTQNSLAGKVKSAEFAVLCSTVQGRWVGMQHCVRVAMGIFVSYCHDDKNCAETFCASLKKYNLPFWWDRLISPGEQFHAAIQRALSKSSVVTVLWSKQAARSKWVQAEAIYAFDKGLLIPIQLSEHSLPVPFNSIQAIMLSPSTPLPTQFDQIAQLLSELLLGQTWASPSSAKPIVSAHDLSVAKSKKIISDVLKFYAVDHIEARALTAEADPVTLWIYGTMLYEGIGTAKIHRRLPTFFIALACWGSPELHTR